MHYIIPMTFPGMKIRFSGTVGTLYITFNVFIKKGTVSNKYQNTDMSPLVLTFIIPIYIIHIHTEKVSAWGPGQSSLWNKFLRTDSLHFLYLYRHFF